MTIEKRNSYRCPSAEDGQKAVIKLGRREIVVALTNQSAGGFSITADTNLRAGEGKLLLVRTSAGWFQAQVVHRHVSQGQTTLGLMRLADLPDPRDAQLVKPGGRKFERSGNASTSTGTLLVIAMIAAIAFWSLMGSFAWFRGAEAAAGGHVDFNAYVSRVIDQLAPSDQHESPASTDAGVETPATN